MVLVNKTHVVISGSLVYYDPAELDIKQYKPNPETQLSHEVIAYLTN